MNSFDNYSAELKFLVHFRLGEQDSVETRLRVILFVASEDDSAPSEILEIAQKFQQLSTVVNRLKAHIYERHYLMVVLAIVLKLKVKKP